MILFSSFVHASYYDLKMTCGEVLKTGNGKLLQRLEPSFFGINDKYVLRTKFINYVEINEVISKKEKPETPSIVNTGKIITYTNFSLKEKFKDLKVKFKNELKESKRLNLPLYACVGHIDVVPFKYKGSHVYYSQKSLKDAIKQMRDKAKKHL